MFACHRCLKLFSELEELQRHLLFTCAIKVDPICPDCKIVFKTMSQLNLHARQYPNSSCKFLLMPQNTAVMAGMKGPVLKEGRPTRPIMPKPVPKKPPAKSKTTIRVNAKDFESIKPCSVNLEKMDASWFFFRIIR